MTPGLVTGELAGRALVYTPSSDVTSAAWDANEAVTHLFNAHYRSLVRLAVLLLHDQGAAEEVAQDAFVALHTRWRRLREADKGLAYLRACVVNKSRSALRHRVVVDRHARSVRPRPDEPSAEAGALGALDRVAVVAALQALPARQREALVLRYYLDLSEAEIAETMGVSRGAVKSHTSRGMAALRATLGTRDEEVTP